VRVRLFAILRERAGSESIEVELSDGATVATALAALSEHPALSAVLARMPVRMAVNRVYASPETPLGPDDELALIPPVSGGAGVHARVTGDPLSLGTLAERVGSARTGAVVAFQGVTREVERLEYEAYGEMAEERILEILSDCAKRHGLEGAAAEHRTGVVALGEPSVIVAVSAPHRAEAFEGAREAIDRIKAEVPVWKREVEHDGAQRWAEGEQPPLDRQEEPAL